MMTDRVTSAAVVGRGIDTNGIVLDRGQRLLA
jgi:hypothetical protein